MNYPNYPCPCLECEKNCRLVGETNWRKCGTYRTWFLWWWKFFQENIPKLSSGCAQTKPQQKPDKFVYFHPCETAGSETARKKNIAKSIKEVSAKKPCVRCSLDVDCNKPCSAYAQWYDASLSLIRKQVGGELYYEDVGTEWFLTKCCAKEALKRS